MCCLLFVVAVMTAGHTADYVNCVLARVAAGDNTGGLEQPVDAKWQHNLDTNPNNPERVRRKVLRRNLS